MVTQANPISIPYSALLQTDFSSLRQSFLDAFGSTSSLGLLIITDLPEDFVQLREKCLRLGCAFAENEKVREKYVDESSRYSFGWSYGKELFNGQPDKAKGSFYNSTVEERTQDPALREKHKDLLSPNIWPTEEDCPGYKEAFQELARFVQDVGVKLSRAMDDVIKEYLPEDQKDVSVARMIAESQTSKARLLHYFPLPGQTISLDSDSQAISQNGIATDDLCSWHLDHSLITGLVSAQFLYHPLSSPQESYPIPCPSKSTGLFIRPRSGNEIVRASIPSNCLAFQTGEALQLLSAGRLQATPHCVQAGDVGGAASEEVKEALKGTKGQGYVTRETMAVFLQPNVHEKLNGKVTFGEFSNKAVESHY